MSFQNTRRRLKFEQESIDDQISRLKVEEPKAISDQERIIVANRIETLAKDRAEIDDAITILYDWVIIRDCIAKTRKYVDIQPPKKS